jgi:hypothetical protein
MKKKAMTSTTMNHPHLLSKGKMTILPNIEIVEAVKEVAEETVTTEAMVVVVPEAETDKEAEGTIETIETNMKATKATEDTKGKRRREKTPMISQTRRVSVHTSSRSSSLRMKNGLKSE